MSSRKPPEPPWQVILEEIRSQNRTTIEAVESNRRILETRIERVETDSLARDAVLELAVRGLVVDMRDVKADLGGVKAELKEVKTELGGVKSGLIEVKASLGEVRADVQGIKGDLRGLTDKVDALGPLDARVSALERRQP